MKNVTKALCMIAYNKPLVILKLLLLLLMLIFSINKAAYLAMAGYIFDSHVYVHAKSTFSLFLTLAAPWT